MPAPTDTFIQTFFQTTTTPPVVFIAIMVVLAILMVTVLFWEVWREIRSYELDTKRRSRWDKELKDNQRNERRPADWGDYR